MKSNLVSALFSIIAMLPFGVMRRLGEVAGKIALGRQSRAAVVTKRNIELCYPHLSGTERQALIEKSMLETGKLALEIPYVWKRSADWLDTRILKEHNLALVHEETDKNRGLIVLAPHMGNWEVVGYQLTKLGKLACMYQPPKQPFMEKIILASRTKLGADVLPTTPRGIAKLFKHLKAGGLTGILPDQSPEHGSGAFAPFFGISTYTMTMIHGLLQRTNCRVVMSVALRVEGGFEMWYLPVDENIYSDDLTISLTAMNTSIEKTIALAPEQYQWEYKRFRHRPKDEPLRDFYKAES